MIKVRESSTATNTTPSDNASWPATSGRMPVVPESPMTSRSFGPIADPRFSLVTRSAGASPNSNAVPSDTSIANTSTRESGANTGGSAREDAST